MSPEESAQCCGSQQVGPASGFVFRVERTRGPAVVREVARAGRPAGQAADRAGVDVARPAGRRLLHEAHGRGLAATRRWPSSTTLAARGAQLGVTFAEAAREWLRYVERGPRVQADDAARLPPASSTTCCPAFGERRLEDITRGRARALARDAARSAPRTKNKLLTILNGIFRRAARRLRHPRQPGRRRSSACASRAKVDIEVFSPEEVWALVRAAADRAGRGDLPHRGVHRPAPRRAASRCAGATSTSPARRSACARATRRRS